jgi:hypothetical protein
VSRGTLVYLERLSSVNIIHKISKFFNLECREIFKMEVSVPLVKKGLRNTAIKVETS